MDAEDPLAYDLYPVDWLDSAISLLPQRKASEESSTSYARKRGTIPRPGFDLLLVSARQSGHLA